MDVDMLTYLNVIKRITKNLKAHRENGKRYNTIKYVHMVGAYSMCLIYFV